MTWDYEEWQWAQRCLCTPPGHRRYWGHASSHHSPSAFGRDCERTVGGAPGDPYSGTKCPCPKYLPIFAHRHPVRAASWPLERLTVSDEGSHRRQVRELRRYLLARFLWGCLGGLPVGVVIALIVLAETHYWG